MLLREFLYVDSDKVRGLLAQLDEGVVEGSTETKQSEKSSGAGVKGFAEHAQKWGNATSIQKSQGDALFPTLEAALESLGLMSDISAELLDPAYWGTDDLQQEFPPGSLVRITAPSALFDARYLATTLTAFATTWHGLVNIGAVDAVKTPAPPLKKGQQGSQRARADASQNSGPANLEDAIPDLGLLYGGEDGITAEFLKGIIRVGRGMFSPGLHLNMLPADVDSHVVTARLQEGRQFLDGDADVLFARYGASLQEWTMVGSIGHYGVDVESFGTNDPGLADAEGNVNRSRFATYVNGLMSFLGNLGFIDAPKAPGFSVVPLAVYRVIGAPASAGDAPAHEVEPPAVSHRG